MTPTRERGRVSFCAGHISVVGAIRDHQPQAQTQLWLLTSSVPEGSWHRTKGF